MQIWEFDKNYRFFKMSRANMSVLNGIEKYEKEKNI